jgi:hypothetical protein
MTVCTISKTSSLPRCKKIPFALIHSPNFEADKFKVQTLLLISPPVFSSGRFRSLHRKFGDTGRMHRSCHSHRIRFYVPLQSIGWWVKVRVQDEHLPAAHHCMHWMCMVELHWAWLCPYYRYMPIIVELPGCSQPCSYRKIIEGQKFAATIASHHNIIIWLTAFIHLVAKFLTECHVPRKQYQTFNVRNTVKDPDAWHLGSAGPSLRKNIICSFSPNNRGKYKDTFFNSLREIAR